MATTAGLLDEHGQALRLDWSEINGRGEMIALIGLSGGNTNGHGPGLWFRSRGRRSSGSLRGSCSSA
jgi:hypothetical protein